MFKAFERNPFIIPWASFLECTSVYDKDGSVERMHRFFTSTAPATKHVVVCVYENMDHATLAEEMLQTVESMTGIKLRFLLSNSSHMAFGTDDPRIAEHLPFLKMCLR